MIRASRIAACCALSLVLNASAADAQSKASRGVIDGVVTDTALAPLANATITLLGAKLQISTGANGRFRISDLPDGDYVVTVRRLGFEPVTTLVTVAAGDTLKASYTLEPLVTTLNTVKVTEKPVAARLQEFEDRRKFGFGHFMNADQIDSTRTTFIADVLRRIPTVQVWDTPTGTVALSSRGNQAGRIKGNDKRLCPYEIFLDGLLKQGPVNLSDLPRPRDIAGIEVYSGSATVPLQYKRMSEGSMCGVILVWTR